MPLNYAQTYAAETDPIFLGRVAVSITKIAQAVQTELPTVQNHAARSALARQVLMATDLWAKIFAINVALAPNVQAAVSLAAAGDGDLDNQASAVWNSYI